MQSKSYYYSNIDARRSTLDSRLQWIPIYYFCFVFSFYYKENYRFNYLLVLSIFPFIISFKQPGESGFVLLGDLTVETSTDPEPDDTWVCDPPSPCDVQFKNANVIVNGKSSLRDKSRSDLKVSLNILAKISEITKFSNRIDKSKHKNNANNFQNALNLSVAHIFFFLMRIVHSWKISPSHSKRKFW